MLETPGFERAPLRLRLGLRFSDVVSLWEEQQLLLSQHPNLFAAPPAIFADCAHLIAENPRPELPLQRKLHGQSSRSVSLAHFHRFLGLLERCCNALSVCRPLLIAPSFTHEWMERSASFYY